jgi:hypothetical protein
MAVNESRLWLPKKYRALKPKLIAAAELAEKSYRCKSVIAGEMIISKSTAENHYFVVTCRDDNQKSYNMSYLYPVAGFEPLLIAEQGRLVSRPVEGSIDDNGSEDQALTICRKAIFDSTKDKGGTTLVEPEIKLVSKNKGSFSYVLPFDIQSKFNNSLRYEADCMVDQNNGVKLAIQLQEAGALMLCEETLPAETVLLKNVELLGQGIIREDADKFHFKMPFKASTLHGENRQFIANCQVNEEDVAEITTELDPESILSICRDGIIKKSKNMLGVVVLENQDERISFINGVYSGAILFDAKSPSGRTLHFQGLCEVYQNGRSTIKIGPRQ